MARRKSGVTTTKTGSGDSIVVLQPQTPAPTTRRRRASRSAPKAKKRGRRRHTSGSLLGAGGGYKTRMIGTALGGAIYGFLLKQFPEMPTVPLLGRSGTIALGCYLFGDKHPIVRDVGIAAAAVAGFTLGNTGQVGGYFGDEHGLASQT